MTTQQEEMERFFGFSMGATKTEKKEAIKEKVDEVKEAVKESEKTSQQLRDIEFLERLGFPVEKVNSPEWKKKSEKEADEGLMATLKKDECDLMAETAQDYYAVLGIARNASQEDIRSKYYELSKKYHPDLQNDATKKIAEEDMGKITEAYKTLSDTEKRKEYDKKFARGASIVSVGKSAVSAVDKFLSNERVANRVGAITQNVGWSMDRMVNDMDRTFNRPSMQSKPSKKPKSIKQVPQQESAINILKKRYAKGEITEAQYNSMKKELQ